MTAGAESRELASDLAGDAGDLDLRVLGNPSVWTVLSSFLGELIFVCFSPFSMHDV
jgi:hypothetical protein